MTETQLKQKVMEFLRTVPHSTWRKIHQTPMSRAGTADILGCLEGRYVAIELKRKKGGRDPYSSLTAAQKEFLREVSCSYGHCLVTDNLQAVKDYIAGFRWLAIK